MTTVSMSDKMLWAFSRDLQGREPDRDVEFVSDLKTTPIEVGGIVEGVPIDCMQTATIWASGAMRGPVRHVFLFRRLYE